MMTIYRAEVQFSFLSEQVIKRYGEGHLTTTNAC